MNIIISFVTGLYSKLLLFYPRRFREEFATEMEVMFRDSVNDAIREGIFPFMFVCLKELGELPLSILREFWHEFERKETMMLHENILNPPEKSATTGQVIMGSLPFFVFGLIMILLELPVALFMLKWVNTLGGILFAAWLILPAIGFGIGWVQNFPRWSYPYTGMAFVLALYISSVSTPGLNFFGIPIFGRELWGWRAWIPLAVTFIVALAISRSLRPFLSFFTNLWNDWSILSYFMVAAVPLLVMFAFDEIDRMYSLYFMIPFGVLLVGMIVFYLRAQHTWQRVLTLTLGVIAIIFPAAWGSTSYWLEHNGIYLSGVQTMFIRAVTIIIIMLLPAWLEFLRRSLRCLRTV